MILPGSSALPLLLVAPLWSTVIGRQLIEFYHRAGVVKSNYRGKMVSAALGPALLLGYLPGAAAVLWIDPVAAPPFSILFLLSLIHI